MEGVSPARAQWEYFRLEDKYIGTQDALLDNAPMPDALVSAKADGTIGKDERARLENSINAKFRGGRRGGVMVTDGSLQVDPLSWSPADLSGLSLSQYDLERICNGFGIHPAMLLKDTNLANLAAAKSYHAEHGIEPRCKLIASSLTAWIQSRENAEELGWDRLFFAFDPAVPKEESAKAELHDKYLKMGAISINEVRHELGYEPVEDGDELLVPGSLKTLDQIVNPPDPPPALDPTNTLGTTNEAEDQEEDLEDEEGRVEPDDEDAPESEASKALDLAGKAIDAVVGQNSEELTKRTLELLSGVQAKLDRDSVSLWEEMRNAPVIDLTGEDEFGNPLPNDRDRISSDGASDPPETGLHAGTPDGTEHLWPANWESDSQITEDVFPGTEDSGNDVVDGAGDTSASGYEEAGNSPAISPDREPQPAISDSADVPVVSANGEGVHADPIELLERVGEDDVSTLEPGPDGLASVGPAPFGDDS